MSTSLTLDTSFASDDVEIPNDPGDVFEDLVADPSLCCQQCYRRLRARHNFPHERGRSIGDILSFVDYDLPEGEPVWNTADRDYHEEELLADRTEEVHPPGDTTSHTGCGFCGAVEPHRSPSTRSRSEALDAAVGIVATLQEWGVSHNPLALLVEVGDLKRDPDMAGDDFGTFATATERAARAGRS